MPLARADPFASREDVLARFHDEIYGRAPTEGWDLSWDLLTEHRPTAGMIRQQWRLSVHTDLGVHRCVVMVDLPEGATSAPAFLGLNFRGNHACSADPDVLDVQRLPPNSYGQIHYEGLREAVTLPVPSAIEAHRWPSELITSRGYAAITACYLQCGPDSADFPRNGLQTLFPPPSPRRGGRPSWGGITTWAWLLSRILDGLRNGMTPAIDAGRVAVVGHSRLGKAALWAAARDPRFAAAISNNSGCMGAAPSRPVGETPEVLARVRPYWFAPGFSDTVLGGVPLPVDQHQLIAAIAPRPVYVASASDDRNADPEGEFASLRASAVAWGTDPSDAAPHFPLPDTVQWWQHVPLGYHLRRGGHEMMPWDWVQWLSFADRWL